MTDFSGIEKSLRAVYPFSEQQLRLFTDKLVCNTLKKKDFLLKPNQLCNGLTFVVSGGLRLYIETERGDLTINFFTENCWVADLESLLTRQPSNSYIEALENSAIATISLNDIHWLMNIHPCYHMLHALIAHLTIPTAQLVTIRTKKPAERYDELLSQKPDWINRFPQRHIASYLGIAPETLSRVRASVI
uniref:Crp/Fnr family transcriptional regulator n=1 Tax=Roseihalotalea indica TaxID=2867963 RepID=A0AA49GT81_9BACT|nr:Crp/Fnr family transcriptional regulator [Tunicatimonas sp. TK19036]